MESLYIRRDGVSLFTESFGDPDDPTVLLIMGAMTSGVWWPKEFCNMLAQKGFFVIRYDHRDTGASTSYEPGSINYSVEDLADDAVRVLDAYEKDTAHLVGMSLGGLLAQFITLKYPSRVQTLTTIASERLALADPNMPEMSPSILEYHAQVESLDWSDHEAVINYQVGAWRLLSGSAHEFDPELTRSLAEEDLARTPDPLTVFNHAQLQDPTVWDPTKWINRLHEITQPALIIHGTEDIVLPYPHAEALNAELPDSRLLTLEGTGHELPRGEWSRIVDAIALHTHNG